MTQYHFTSWPDHGVPEYAGPILNYLRRIKAQHKQNKGPILVHCRYKLVDKLSVCVLSVLLNITKFGKMALNIMMI